MNDLPSPLAAESPLNANPGPGRAAAGPTRAAFPWIALFATALVAHFVLATFNWRSSTLVGHEFRQTHTAIIAYYIDREDRFSLRYTTPLFGKPWSVPMEFPLYEWSVVLLSRAAHLPHFAAARTVSLACFYLTLPAVFLLLGSAGLAPARRLLVLSLILLCPVYIFYSRAFLIESMAVMFSAWFLAAFVRMLPERRFHWLLVCAVAGTGAGLVKSTTFLVWLLPAAVCGMWRLARNLRARDRWRLAGPTLGWGLGAALLPIGMTIWWIKFTDALKVHHPSAHIFASRELTEGSFGLYSLAARFSPVVWRELMADWRLAIMPPWLIAGFVVGGAILLRRQRRSILAAAGLFLSAQILFPEAYAAQDYYFYACTIFLLIALGYVLLGVLESPLPRWLRAALVLGPLIALPAGYATGYFREQRIHGHGGWGLTDAIRALTPVNSVIVVAGADWAPMIPYYSERRALMIRAGLQYDQAYLARAFRDLDGEDVGALVMVGDERRDRAHIARAAGYFHLDPAPTFSAPFADVYLNEAYRENALDVLTRHNGFYQVTTRARPEAAATPAEAHDLAPAEAAGMFSMVTPPPVRARFTYGYSGVPLGETTVLSCHPNTDLWVRPPAGATEIRWEFGILPGAYQRTNGVTSGVELLVAREGPGGARQPIFRRLLQPATVPGDRGTQQAVLPCRGPPGDTLVFSTRPNGNPNFDWAYTVRIEVK